MYTPPIFQMYIYMYIHVEGVHVSLKLQDHLQPLCVAHNYKAVVTILVDLEVDRCTCTHIR